MVEEGERKEYEDHPVAVDVTLECYIYVCQ